MEKYRRKINKVGDIDEISYFFVEGLGLYFVVLLFVFFYRLVMWKRV